MKDDTPEPKKRDIMLPWMSAEDTIPPFSGAGAFWDGAPALRVRNNSIFWGCPVFRVALFHGRR